MHGFFTCIDINMAYVKAYGIRVLSMWCMQVSNLSQVLGSRHLVFAQCQLSLLVGLQPLEFADMAAECSCQV